MTTLTAANVTVTLSIASIFPTPQQIQGFGPDDVIEFADVEPAEIQTGVDGKMSYGWVFVPVPMDLTLQADSASNNVFEAWNAAQQANQEIYVATGVIHVPGTARGYIMTNGVLTTYKPGPPVKKLLQPRKYKITWQSVIAGPI
jgi:hypothetical protein